MPTKEQELTFENIAEFFSLSEEIVEVISDNVDDLSEADILDRLKVVEKFIEQAVECAELIAEDYDHLAKSELGQEQKKEDIKEQIVLMIIALNKCKEQLLAKLDYEQ